MENRFESIELTDEQRDDVENMKAFFEALELVIENTEMSPRERALALTKLEECAMWANKGISRREKEVSVRDDANGEISVEDNQENVRPN